MSDLLKSLRSEQLLYNIENDSPLSFDEYQRFAVGTDKTQEFARGPAAIRYLSLGLFGEAGSLLSELKKKIRDNEAYNEFARVQIEEFGDVLWYLTVAGTKLDISLQQIVEAALKQEIPQHTYRGKATPRTFIELQLAPPSVIRLEDAQDALLKLGSHVGMLLEDTRLSLTDTTDHELFKSSLASIFRYMLFAADSGGVSIANAAEENIRKTVSRWPMQRTPLPRFDLTAIPEEHFPDNIEMTFRQKISGEKKYVYQSWRGVNIGDRLTDNASEEDDFRFHDVFHLSYYAILGWSPVLRALLRLKRKGQPKIDEVEDGARAILIEEGISTWIFNHSKELHFYDGIRSLDYGLLKAIERLVVGFEVEKVKLWQWEEAILRGYGVFRELRKHQGGVVIADLEHRSISFKALS